MLDTRTPAPDDTFPADPGATLAHADSWRERVRRNPWSRVALTVLCCYLTGLAVTNLASTTYGGVINRIFPHVLPGGFNQTSVDQAWSTIQANYVLRNVPGDLGTQATEQGMIDGLKNQYHDRFTAFFTKDQFRQFNSDLNGQRSGSIGISLESRCPGEHICAPNQTPTELVIESVLRNQPADRAGLRNGDVLVAAGGVRLSSLGATPDAQLAKASPMIRGPAGTTVDLTVSRSSMERTVTVTRADLNIPSVYSTMMGSVLYLQVTGFATDTGNAARDQLQKGLSAGATAVVLDLRHDGGGYVSAAQSLASQFLTRGGQEQDVVVRRGRMDVSANPSTAENVIHDQIQDGGIAARPKLVVLIDQDTASASEIVSAALRDYHRATLVGMKTFGKGSVQLDFTLPDGNDLHLTVEKWYGPNGETIDEQGISPDQIVNLANPDQRFSLDAQSVDAGQDPQLQAGLRAAAG